MANEAVSKSGLAAGTFGRASAHYDSSPYLPMAGRRLVDLAEIGPGARVLDVASGTGAVLFPAAERTGAGGRLTVSTWGPPNERATAYNKLFERHGGPIPNLGSHTLTSAEVVRTVLQETEFDVTYAADESLSVRFAGAEQWWAQRMACPQVYSETLPSDQQAQLKAEVLAMLESSATPNGIDESRTAVFASALKPS